MDAVDYLPEDFDPTLLPASWEVALELRRHGDSTKPPRPDDLGRSWTLSCLTWAPDELRRIRDLYAEMWRALPDGRYRTCGNGRRLRAFLDRSEALLRAPASPDAAAALLALEHPTPRPA